MKKKAAIKPKNIIRNKKVKKIDPPKSALDKWSLWFYSKLNFIFGK
jgi:hypothetical protein